MISSVISRSQLRSRFSLQTCANSRCAQNATSSCSGRPSHDFGFGSASPAVSPISLSHGVCSTVCPIGVATAAVGCGTRIALTVIPKARAHHRIATSCHLGTVGAAVATLSLRRAVEVCPGRSRTSRAAVTRASIRARGPSGIFAMLCARQSIIAAFGNLVSLAASAHGSCPSRARMERIVSGEPLSSVPTSAKRNSLRPEFFNAKASGWDIAIFQLQAEIRWSRPIGRTACAVAMIGVSGASLIPPACSPLPAVSTPLVMTVELLFVGLVDDIQGIPWRTGFDLLTRNVELDLVFRPIDLPHRIG